MQKLIIDLINVGQVSFFTICVTIQFLMIDLTNQEYVQQLLIKLRCPTCIERFIKINDLGQLKVSVLSYALVLGFVLIPTWMWYQPSFFPDNGFFGVELYYILLFFDTLLLLKSLEIISTFAQGYVINEETIVALRLDMHVTAIKNATRAFVGRLFVEISTTIFVLWYANDLSLLSIYIKLLDELLLGML